MAEPTSKWETHGLTQTVSEIPRSKPKNGYKRTWQWWCHWRDLINREVDDGRRIQSNTYQIIYHYRYHRVAVAVAVDVAISLGFLNNLPHSSISGKSIVSYSRIQWSSPLTLGEGLWQSI